MAKTTPLVRPSDMELTALISSKICHDIINPVGAIYNGLEILDEEEDPASRAYALDVIRNVTTQASARLEFARFAFGAWGAAGSKIDLTTAENVCRGYLGQGKHKLAWTGEPGYVGKDRAKLLLNMVSAAINALPRGGDIMVTVLGPLDSARFEVRCRGTGARPPNFLVEYLTGSASPPLDTMSIQPYYTVRLAETAGMQLEVKKDGADVLLTAS